MAKKENKNLSQEQIDFNFSKINLIKFIKVINGLTKKELIIFLTLFQRSNSKNVLSGTQKDIASWCSMHENNAKKIFKKFYELDLMKKLKNGIYIINPNVIFEGTIFLRKVSSKIYLEKNLDARI